MKKLLACLLIAVMVMMTFAACTTNDKSDLNDAKILDDNVGSSDNEGISYDEEITSDKENDDSCYDFGERTVKTEHG